MKPSWFFNFTPLHFNVKFPEPSALRSMTYTLPIRQTKLFWWDMKVIQNSLGQRNVNLRSALFQLFCFGIAFGTKNFCNIKYGRSHGNIVALLDLPIMKHANIYKWMLVRISCMHTVLLGRLDFLYLIKDINRNFRSRAQGIFENKDLDPVGR